MRMCPTQKLQPGVHGSSPGGLHWNKKELELQRRNQQWMKLEGGGKAAVSQWGENAKVEKERNKPIKAGSGPGEGEGVM